MKTASLFLLVVMLFGSTSLISCSNSAGSGTTNPDYFSITGTISNPKSLTIPSDAKVFALWIVSSSSPDYEYVYGTGSINTTANTFSLTFTTPPPFEALNSNYLGVGYVLLTTASVKEGKVDGETFLDSTTFWGAINDHAVIYLNGDPKLRTDWVKQFQTRYNMGKGWYNPNPGFDGFEPELAPLELLIRPDTLKFPNWT